MRQIGLWLCCIKKLSKLLCLQLRKHKEIYFIFLHLHIVDVHLNLGVLIMLSAEMKHSWGIPCYDTWYSNNVWMGHLWFPKAIKTLHHNWNINFPHFEAAFPSLILFCMNTYALSDYSSVWWTNDMILHSFHLPFMTCSINAVWHRFTNTAISV